MYTQLPQVMGGGDGCIGRKHFGMRDNKYCRVVHNREPSNKMVEAYKEMVLGKFKSTSNTLHSTIPCLTFKWNIPSHTHTVCVAAED